MALRLEQLLQVTSSERTTNSGLGKRLLGWALSLGPYCLPPDTLDVVVCTASHPEEGEPFSSP